MHTPERDCGHMEIDGERRFDNLGQSDGRKYRRDDGPGRHSRALHLERHIRDGF